MSVEMSKKILLFLCIVTLVSANDELFKGASSKFAVNLMQKTVESSSGNVIISPYLVQKALTMSMLCATGDTQTEMKQALNYGGLSNDEISGIYEKFTREFKDYENLKTADKFYLMENYSLKPSYKSVALRSFDSDFENVNFAENENAANTINEWIQAKTDDKIKDVVRADSLDSDTKFIIVNAVHFKDQWLHKFNPKDTVKSKFYIDESSFVETDFMTIEREFPIKYMNNLEAMVVKIPYKDPDTSMFIVVPDSKTGLASVEEKLVDIDLNSFEKRMHNLEATLVIPKFSFAFEVEMDKILKSMGIKKAFDNDAEFSNLIDSEEQIHISKVLHKSFVGIDENGTVATAVVVQQFVAISAPFYIEANHPFLLIIKSKSQILFMGRFVNPEN